MNPSSAVNHSASGHVISGSAGRTIGRHKSKELDMNKQWGIGLSIVALAVALTGCGGPGTTPATSTATTAGSATSASARAVLKTASTAAGPVVVDAKGMSVYFFTKDVKDSGTSACTGACTAAWPPVLTDSGTPAVEGMTGTAGTISTPEGKKQVTVNGLPVYYYVKDKAPGDITGQGVNDAWYLVSPAGDMVKMAAGGGY
jgi:predicted lipoprotein with Yx(FWY)xxD motif